MLKNIARKILPVGMRRMFICSVGRYVGRVLRIGERNLKTRGPVSLRIRGELKITGTLYLGYYYGLRITAPTFVNVNDSGLFEVLGTVFFSGGNTINIQHNATLSVGNKTRIMLGTKIHVKSSIKIGNECLISANVHIRDNDGHKINGAEGISPVYIGNKVWVGYGSIILKGVCIGDGSIIGAGSVVASDIPPKCIAAGNPARVLRYGIEWEA